MEKTLRHFSISPWWLLAKDTPAVLVLRKHCQTPHGVSGTRFKTSYSERLHNPENSMLSAVAWFCVPTGIRSQAGLHVACSY